MRLTVALIIISLAAAAWFTSALWVERQHKLHGATLNKADLQLCMPLRPAPPAPPLIRHRGANGRGMGSDLV